MLFAGQRNTLLSSVLRLHCWSRPLHINNRSEEPADLYRNILDTSCANHVIAITLPLIISQSEPVKMEAMFSKWSDQSCALFFLHSCTSCHGPCDPELCEIVSNLPNIVYLPFTCFILHPQNVIFEIKLHIYKYIFYMLDTLIETNGTYLHSV